MEQKKIENWNSLMKNIFNTPTERRKFALISESDSIQSPMNIIKHRRAKLIKKQKIQNHSFIEKRNHSLIQKRTRRKSSSIETQGRSGKKMKRLNQLYPDTIVMQHINDQEFTKNRRTGMLGKMRDLLLKHTTVVRAINYWTSSSNPNPDQQSNKLIKMRGSFNPVLAAKEIQRTNKISVFDIKPIAENNFLQLNQQQEKPEIQISNRKKIEIDYESSSDDSDQIKNGNKNDNQKSIKNKKLFNLLKQSGTHESKTVQNYILNKVKSQSLVGSTSKSKKETADKRNKLPQVQTSKQLSQHSINTLYIKNFENFSKKIILLINRFIQKKEIQKVFEQTGLDIPDKKFA